MESNEDKCVGCKAPAPWKNKKKATIKPYKKTSSQNSQTNTPCTEQESPIKSEYLMPAAFSTGTKSCHELLDQA